MILFGCFRREQQGGGNPELLLLFLTKKKRKVKYREDAIQQELGGNVALGCPKSKQRAMKKPDFLKQNLIKSF